MKDHNRPDWATLITTLGNHISSGNRTEEVDMSMWDTLFPLAKEEHRGSDIAQYSAVYQGNRYELFTCVGDPLCINKIIERITLNKKARQIEWERVGSAVRGWLDGRLIYNISGFSFDRFVVDVNLPPSPLHSDYSVDTIHHTICEAKEACQQHLQQYVDSLYNALQQLTEELI